MYGMRCRVDLTRLVLLPLRFAIACPLRAPPPAKHPHRLPSAPASTLITDSGTLSAAVRVEVPYENVKTRTAHTRTVPHPAHCHTLSQSIPGRGIDDGSPLLPTSYQYYAPTPRHPRTLARTRLPACPSRHLEARWPRRSRASPCERARSTSCRSRAPPRSPGRVGRRRRARAA